MTLHKKARKPNPLKVSTRSAVRKGEPKDEAHLARVRTLGCIVCAAFGLVQKHPTHAHHCRSGMMGKRTPDRTVVPVCAFHHLDQFPAGLHRVGEAKFWAWTGIDAANVAAALYAETLAARRTA